MGFGSWYKFLVFLLWLYYFLFVFFFWNGGCWFGVWIFGLEDLMGGGEGGSGVCVEVVVGECKEFV